MSEMAEVFSGLKKHNQEKRAANRDASARILAEEGINFRSNNGGAHLIVEQNGLVFDFWPGTGKWIERTTNYHHRGVRNLINMVKKHSTGKAGAE